MRQLKLLERFLCEVDTALRTIFVPKQRVSQRPNPAEMQPEQAMTMQEKRHAAGLMRVNHAGEVCAQALYQGQAATARLTEIKQKMTQAAEEEVDHLAWCEARLRELDSRPSTLNFIWYSGSYMLGALAGLAGDRWSLGFVAETERQVAAHLQNHLKNLPKQDLKTKAILVRMQDDETQHAETAIAAGAAELPVLIKQVMSGTSKLLTWGSYYI
jgi:ubiquinone biosynthesis monooxygenase Coq7